jgi:hypothetical protein
MAGIRAPVKPPVMKVIELDSDSESEPEKSLVGRGSGGAVVHDHSRVKANEHDTTRATEGDEEASQERDSEDDDWDVESIFEDTIEEVADDQLLENNGMLNVPLFYAD